MLHRRVHRVNCLDVELVCVVGRFRARTPGQLQSIDSFLPAHSLGLTLCCNSFLLSGRVLFAPQHRRGAGLARARSPVSQTL